jgi:hypothetical protein
MLLKGSSIEHKATAFCSLQKLFFCTAIWLMSIRRLKICPTGCLDEAWALAISLKSLTAIPIYTLQSFSGANLGAGTDCQRPPLARAAVAALAAGVDPHSIRARFVVLTGPRHTCQSTYIRGLTSSTG